MGRQDDGQKPSLIGNFKSMGRMPESQLTMSWICYAVAFRFEDDDKLLIFKSVHPRNSGKYFCEEKGTGNSNKQSRHNG